MRQKLSDALEDYEAFRRSSGIQKGTLQAHRSYFTKFLAVTGNVYVHSIDERHITRHFEEAAKTNQPQTLNNHRVALSKFFEWARKTKRMPLDSDPLFGRRKIKSIKRERERVHISKFPALLEAAEDRSRRDRAIVALLLYTLARDSEITDLRVRDVDLAAGYIHLRIHKTREEDRVPICSELDFELRRWLSHYAASECGMGPNSRLVPARRTQWVKGGTGRFVRPRGEELVPDTKAPRLGGVVKPILEDIGFPTTTPDGKPLMEGAHTLRRSGARALFDRLVSTGYDQALRIVQSMLHHNSQTTTESYIGVTADRRSRDDLLRGKPMYDLSGEAVPLGGRIHAAHGSHAVL